jgi:hypothetical protein
MTLSFHFLRRETARFSSLGYCWKIDGFEMNGMVESPGNKSKIVATPEVYMKLMTLPLLMISVAVAVACASEEPKPTFEPRYVPPSGATTSEGESQAQELLGTKPPVEPASVGTSGSGISIRGAMTCTADDGRVLSSQDAGYDLCVARGAKSGKAPAAGFNVESNSKK